MPNANLGLDTQIAGVEAVSQSATGWASKVRDLARKFRDADNPFGSAALKDVGTEAGQVPLLGTDGRFDAARMPEGYGKDVAGGVAGLTAANYGFADAGFGTISGNYFGISRNQLPPHTTRRIRIFTFPMSNPINQWRLGGTIPAGQHVLGIFMHFYQISNLVVWESSCLKRSGSAGTPVASWYYNQTTRKLYYFISPGTIDRLYPDASGSLAVNPLDYRLIIAVHVGGG